MDPNIRPYLSPTDPIPLSEVPQARLVATIPGRVAGKRADELCGLRVADDARVLARAVAEAAECLVEVAQAVGPVGVPGAARFGLGHGVGAVGGGGGVVGGVGGLQGGAEHGEAVELVEHCYALDLAVDFEDAGGVGGNGVPELVGRVRDAGVAVIAAEADVFRELDGAGLRGNGELFVG